MEPNVTQQNLEGAIEYFRKLIDGKNGKAKITISKKKNDGLNFRCYVEIAFRSAKGLEKYSQSGFEHMNKNGISIQESVIVGTAMESVDLLFTESITLEAYPLEIDCDKILQALYVVRAYGIIMPLEMKLFESQKIEVVKCALEMH